MQIERVKIGPVSADDAEIGFRSGSVAFLFTDIEGSTSRWERWPDAMERAVDWHDRLLRALCATNGGHIFKTMGDAFCVAFSNPFGALNVAIDAQQALDAEDFSAIDGLRVRMAIHVGIVQARDGDYFGRAVNRVARLVSIAHGQQIIVSNSAAEALAELLPPLFELIDLGEHRLRDLAEPEHVFQLVGGPLRTDFPPLRSLSVLRHNLPFQATSFVGRESELSELKRVVGAHRLVTLVGAGGMGKTRLSLQIAADLLTRFPDGVWLVELAPIGRPELIAETLASLFGLHVSAGADALAQITLFLAHKRMLLILDNCEHLLLEAARVAASIIRAAPGVQIMASSRERLGIGGEFVYQVPALGVPRDGARVTVAEALNHAAIRLFVERAELVLNGFTLTDEIASDVAAICRRLDGIALAIELAVPRLRMLRSNELLARLDDRFRILTSGDRAALPRQQTLKALIDWSYDLLSPDEQLALRRLSVFADTIMIDDAIRVVSDELLDEWTIFDVIAGLLEKSLIARVGGDSAESRYRMFESTRVYALERLAESGEEPRFRRRLVNLLLERFHQADIEYQKAATEPWLARYGPELENIRATLDWSFGPSGDPAAGAELISRSHFFLEEMSLPRERARWLDAASAVLTPATPPNIAGAILFGQANSGFLGERRDIAKLRRAVELLREADDRLALGCALASLGKACARPGDVTEAEIYYSEAEALLRPLGATRGLCNLLIARAAARDLGGDPERAKALPEEPIEMARAIGDRRALLIATSNLAEFEFANGGVERALELAREAEQAARDANALVPLAMLCMNLTGYLIAMDDIAAALPLGLEALQLNVSLGQDYFAVICLEHLALIRALSGHTDSAARLAGHTDVYYRSETRTRESTEQSAFDRLIAILREALSSEDLASAMDAGARWDRLDAAAEADGRIR